jgi:hypothetical protein
MDADKEAVLLRLARAIADGIPVDWQAELVIHPALASHLERLKSLEAMAVAHRGGASEPRQEISGSEAR